MHTCTHAHAYVHPHTLLSSLPTPLTALAHAPSSFLPNHADWANTRMAFVEFTDVAGSQKAMSALSGRTFDGRRVDVTFVSEENFKARNFA